jgi:hypothetical protein
MEEDGIYSISFKVSATVSGVGIIMLEMYCCVDGESPPAGAPSALQKNKIFPATQMSLVDSELSEHVGGLYLALRRGQTLSLAIRWVAGAAGSQSFIVQSARLGAVKLAF